MKFLPQLTLVFILSFLLSVSVEAKRITSFEKRPACEDSGGVWRQFGNACADGCLVKFNKFTMCAQALTYSCDCLENSCFDGDKCIGMAEYKIKYDEIKSHEEELLNNLKEARQGEYERNRQRIMQKLFGTPQEEENKAKNLDGVSNQRKTPSNNNLAQRKPITKKGINAVITSPALTSDTDFKVPPLFEQNQKSLNKQNNDSVSNGPKKTIALPNIPLPNL